jgi:hypothetical protein
MDNGDTSFSLLGDLLLKIKLGVSIDIRKGRIVKGFSLNQAQEGRHGKCELHLILLD